MAEIFQTKFNENRKSNLVSEIAMNRWIYPGVFFVALATLMFEILLLRIFSVTMWYHFAFMAISIALFGMTVGAVIVYLLPSIFNKDKLRYHLSLSAFLFAVFAVVNFITYLLIPFELPTFAGASLLNLLNLTFIYLLISVPFIFSGICITLALTKFPLQVGKLYAADLIGAASGCILLIMTLSITSGPTAVLVVGTLAAVGALFFTQESGLKKLQRAAFFACLIFILIAVANTITLNKQAPFLRLIWVKGGVEWGQIYEKWNSFSRITIWGNKDELVVPYGWGMSPTYPVGKKINQLWLFIDSTAGTPLTGFDGNLAKIDFLKYDIVNLAHYLRKDGDILVVGPGGGRDILSALVFNQKSVIGVEVNKNILEAVNKKFGDFTGHLDKYPQVKFVNDEARSHVARSKEKFDIIQVSLIDSWAATAAGAFVLTENSLYTVEAWKSFLNHLRPNGILTFSRWYFRDQPGEVYRLTALASQALKGLGVQNPRDHVIIARRMGEQDKPDAPDGVGTILVSKEPFTVQDMVVATKIINQMQFEIVLSPQFAIDETFAVLASQQRTEEFISRFPINISAPTDDNPFFFHMLRLKDALKLKAWEQGKMSMNMRAVAVLGILLIITFTLSLIFIISPLIVKTSSVAPFKMLPFLMYFAGIGLGFMLVEISQMQRLIILLGHPVYGLSVLLFSLLISSGAGSFTVRGIKDDDLFKSATPRLSLIIISLAIFGFLTPYIINYFETANTTIHIILAVAILFPIGFLMGMAFPLGMRLANSQMPNLMPLFWGVNGATSVFASVLAIVLALSWGISVAFWVGVAFYIIVLCSFVWIKKNLLSLNF